MSSTSKNKKRKATMNISKTSSAKSKIIRSQFRYGVEYETLIYSELLKNMYEKAKNESKGKTYANNVCGFLDFNSHNNKNFNNTPYRKIMQELFGEEKFVYEWYNSKLCPTKFGNFQPPYTKWAITFDSSVIAKDELSQQTIKPIYNRIDDLITTNVNDVLASEMIDYIEIVSPPLTRKEIDEGEIQDIFKILSYNDKIKYYNNPKTSNHIHMSCASYFENPNIIYNLYIVWMIAEPLILLSLPYWRRDNWQYAQSIYSALKSRYGANVKNAYNTLINMNHKSTSTELFDLFKMTPKYYLRSVNKELLSVLTELNGTVNNLPITNLSNNALFNQSDKFISTMIFASIFQDYIGKKDEHGQYKANVARYAAFNCLNLLNANPEAQTVEIRIKHGSDDPDEIQAYLDLFTELAIVAINQDKKSFMLNDEEIELITSTSLLILINPKIQIMPEDSPLLKIFDKHIFNDPINNNQKASRKFIIEHINKMNQLSGKIQGGQQPDEQLEEQLDKQLEKQLDKQLEKQPKKQLEEQPKKQPKKQLEKQPAKKREKTWVFCYGSNGMEQLRGRVDHKGDWEYRPVVLKGYARIFSGYSGTWNGAVASIWPDPKKKVYGSIVKMTKTEIKKLDQYEGVGAAGWYYQDTFRVHDVHTGEAYTAMGYVKEDMEMTAVPSVKYLHSIELNLKAAGLKPSQIGKAIKIYGIPDTDLKVKEIGKWVYGSDKISFANKRYEKNFA